MSKRASATIWAITFLLVVAVAYLVFDKLKTVDPGIPEMDGVAVAKVIDARLEKVADIRVTSLSGTGQGVACVNRMWKMLRPCRVFRAPAKVDYFVDVSRLNRGNFFWNEQTKTLTVEAPDVRVGPTNIDTSRISFDDTTGIWVSRGAMAELEKKSSTSAHRAARQEAEKPENLELARRHGRVLIASLFQRPLQAAGIKAKVMVRFAGDPASNGERWDMSRPLSEVLGNGA